MNPPAKAVAGYLLTVVMIVFCASSPSGCEELGSLSKIGMRLLRPFLEAAGESVGLLMALDLWNAHSTAGLGSSYPLQGRCRIVFERHRS